MFILQESPIDLSRGVLQYAPTDLQYTPTDNHTGALVSFEGIVRADDIKASQTTALLYIADEAACRQEGKKIIQEALDQFPITKAVCIQRIGKIQVGQTAVWIGVWASHRDAAFQACRYLIEEIKKRLLIWKKEFLANGTTEWVRGQETPVVS